MKQLTLFCLLFVFQIFGAIPDICVHCWYEVPNSKLSTVAQSPKPPGIAGSEGKLIGNGAAFDSRRNRLIVTGGGSISYSGNEVYAFSLDSLKWTRIKNGASVYDNDDLLYAYYRNGKAVPDSQQPRPGFNYDQIDYDSTTDNLYIFGAPFAATHGKTWKNIFQLNLSTLAWSRPTDIRSGMFIGNVSARDPSTGQIWFMEIRVMDGYRLLILFLEHSPIMEII